ncbi:MULTISPECIES: Rrf2 family transcriptional regulator [unclassified Schlesneria]|uniref:RrF2 family transcriptional regulator n=1 Tax=Schlesneria TaxID=656899 RepID=UPI002EF485F9
MAATSVQFSVAIHMMAALAEHYGEAVRSDQLAASVKADSSFIRRSLSKLAKAGLVETTRGRNGACSLARPPEEITLLDIYRASGAPPPFSIHHYDVQEKCSVSVHIKFCLGDVLDKVRLSFEETLSKTTLADIISDLRKRSCKDRSGPL